MKTFNEIIAQPTTSQSGLKEKLALTKMVNANELQVAVTGTITVNGTELNPFAVIAGAFLPVYDEKFKQTLDDTLSLFKNGYVIPTQANIAKNGIKETVINNDNDTVSSFDYYKTAVIAALIDEQKALINTLRSSATLNELDNYKLLLSKSTLATYSSKVELEEQTAKKYKLLTDNNFTDITVKDKKIFAKITLAHSQIALTAAIKAGYIVQSTQLDHSTMSLTVIMLDKA